MHRLDKMLNTVSNHIEKVKYCHITYSLLIAVIDFTFDSQDDDRLHDYNVDERVKAFIDVVNEQVRSNYTFLCTYNFDAMYFFY